MNRRIFSVASVAALAALLCLAGCAETRLTLQLVDASSGAWVWDATLRLQDRTIRSFYQSDAGPLPMEFTHLTPGPHELIISAPGYAGRTLQLTLKRGANRLEEPVRLRGIAIPGLTHVSVFERPENGRIVAELHPIDAAGKAVLNHPCLPLWVECRIYVQVKGGVPVQEATETGSERGTLVFEGRLHPAFDSAPEKTYRYSAQIPGAAFGNAAGPFRVIDYLIVVPDPRVLSPEALTELMDRVWALRDQRAMASALDRERGRLQFYFDSSWNVRVPAQ